LKLLVIRINVIIQNTWSFNIKGIILAYRIPVIYRKQLAAGGYSYDYERSPTIFINITDLVRKLVITDEA